MASRVLATVTVDGVPAQPNARPMIQVGGLKRLLKVLFALDQSPDRC
jgi:hypothetical protein